MNYEKDPEKCLRYSDFRSESKLYYMLDKDGNVLKSIFTPAIGVRNSIFSIPKKKDIEDYALNLLPYFKRYFQ